MIKSVQNIPNILSVTRIIIALLFPFLPSHLRIFFLSLAFLTEYFDGVLARKYNWVTAAGQVLDPVADKLLALSVGLTFVIADKISLQELIFIYIRDITAATGFLAVLLIFKNYKMLQQKFRPNLFGKIATTFQYLVFFDLLLTTTPHTWLIFLTGTISLIAAVLYTLNFFRSFNF